jgi:hypothetical protein
VPRAIHDQILCNSAFAALLPAVQDARTVDAAGNLNRGKTLFLRARMQFSEKPSLMRFTRSATNFGLMPMGSIYLMHIPHLNGRISRILSIMQYENGARWKSMLEGLAE